MNIESIIFRYFDFWFIRLNVSFSDRTSAGLVNENITGKIHLYLSYIHCSFTRPEDVLSLNETCSRINQYRNEKSSVETKLK